MERLSALTAKYLNCSDRSRSRGRAALRQLGRLSDLPKTTRGSFCLIRVQLLSGLTPGVPVIHFSTGTGGFLKSPPGGRRRCHRRGLEGQP